MHKQQPTGCTAQKGQSRCKNHAVISLACTKLRKKLQRSKKYISYTRGTIYQSTGWLTSWHAAKIGCEEDHVSVRHSYK